MKRLLDECAAASGVNYHFDITDPTELADKQARFERLMIKLKGAKAKQIIKVEVTPRSSDSLFLYNYPFDIYAFNLLTSRYAFTIFDVPIFMRLYFLCFRRDCRLTFNNLPTSHNWGVWTDEGQFIPINNGTTLTFEAGSAIIFYNRDRPFDDQALRDAYNETFRFDFELTEEMMNYGEVYYLQSNLPDVTYVDLLTTTAYALGLSLTSDIENSRFVLSDYTLASSPPLTIDSVTVRDEHLIEIDDLGISGIVDFDSSSWVLEEMKLKLMIGSGEGNNVRSFGRAKNGGTEDVEFETALIDGRSYFDITLSRTFVYLHNNDTSIYLQRLTLWKVDWRQSSIPIIFVKNSTKSVEVL